MNDTPLPPADMLSIREVCHFFGGNQKPLDQSTIYRWVRLGKLPKPVRMSGTLLRWRRADLLAVMADMERASGVAK